MRIFPMLLAMWFTFIIIAVLNGYEPSTTEIVLAYVMVVIGFIRMSFDN